MDFKVIIKKHLTLPGTSEIVYYPTKNFLWVKSPHDTVYTEKEVVNLYYEFATGCTDCLDPDKYTFQIYRKGKKIPLLVFRRRYCYGGLREADLKGSTLHGFKDGWIYWDWETQCLRIGAEDAVVFPPDNPLEFDRWNNGFKAGQIARVLAGGKASDKFPI